MFSFSSTETLAKFITIIGLTGIFYVIAYNQPDIKQEPLIIDYQKYDVYENLIDSLIYIIKRESQEGKPFDSIRHEYLINLASRTSDRFKKNIQLDSIKSAYAHQYYVIKKIQVQEKQAQNRIILYSSILFFAIGMRLWYREEKNKKIQKGIWKDRCQSCYKKIPYPSDRGLELNGSISNDYCKACYENGHFKEPDLTYDEARKRLEQNLEDIPEKQRTKVLKELPELIRWAPKF